MKKLILLLVLCGCSQAAAVTSAEDAEIRKFVDTVPPYTTMSEESKQNAIREIQKMSPEERKVLMESTININAMTEKVKEQENKAP